MTKPIDPTGKQFGMLFVIGAGGATPAYMKQKLWRVRCDCGRELDLPLTKFYHGMGSCGCMEVEHSLPRTKALVLTKEEREIIRLAKRTEKQIIADKKRRRKEVPEGETLSPRGFTKLAEDILACQKETPVTRVDSVLDMFQKYRDAKGYVPGVYLSR